MPLERKSLELERYRNYLLLLARMHVGDQYRGKLEPSDLVQQTLLEAHQKQDQFRGGTDAELAGWLRQMLAFGMRDAERGLTRAKRSIDREQSLHAELDASSARLENWLAAETSSPSHHARRHELVVQLTEALTQLPPHQRDALIMRHCQCLPLAEIGKKLGCNPPAVVGLIQRGTKQLRKLLNKDES